MLCVVALDEQGRTVCEAGSVDQASAHLVAVEQVLQLVIDCFSVLVVTYDLNP